MHNPSVFVDACVLYSSTLRGWVFNMSESGAFTLLTTEDVIAEAVARWRDNNPTANGAVTTRMAQHCRELSTVIDNYDCDVPFPGDDEGDIHVHAACLDGRVEYLVTADKGFLNLPDEIKDELPYEIYNADDFFTLVHAQMPARIRELVRREIARQVKLGNEPRIGNALRSAGVPEFADLVAGHAVSLAGAGPLVHAKSSSEK